MSRCEVGIEEGGGNIQNMYALNLKVSFLPVKMSSLNHTNVWRPKLC